MRFVAVPTLAAKLWEIITAARAGGGGAGERKVGFQRLLVPREELADFKMESAAKVKNVTGEVEVIILLFVLLFSLFKNSFQMVFWKRQAEKQTRVSIYLLDICSKVVALNFSVFCSFDLIIFLKEKITIIKSNQEKRVDSIVNNSNKKNSEKN
eukprot:gene449-232_t